MNEIQVKRPTLTDLRQVVNDLVRGETKHGDATGYDQASWCGTACCVWGHTYAQAGNTVLYHDPNRDGVYNELLKIMNKVRRDFLFELPLDLAQPLKRLFQDHEAVPQDFAALLAAWPDERVSEALKAGFQHRHQDEKETP